MSSLNVNQPPWSRFTDFIQAREQLRIRKQKDQRPWTEDPILAKYRFCNIRRRDDRVSQWIREHVIAPYPQASHLGEWLALARYVNWPPTLKMLLENGHTPARALQWEGIARLLDLRL